MVDKLPYPPLSPDRHLRPSGTFDRPVLVFSIAMVVLILGIFLLPIEWRSSGRWAAFGIIVAAIVCFVVYWILSIRAFNARNKVAVDMMNAGRLKDAAAFFERSARSGIGIIHAVSLYNLGLARLKLGDVNAALMLWGAADRDRNSGMTPIRHHTPALISMGYSLRDKDDLTAAEAWLGEAKERARRPSVFSHLHVLAEGVWLCRQGQFGLAAGLLERHWKDADRALAGDFGRVLRLVRAFAIENGAPDSDKALVADLVAGARPFDEGEYDFLGHDWPEFARFLEAHGFSKR